MDGWMGIGEWEGVGENELRWCFGCAGSVDLVVLKW